MARHSARVHRGLSAAAVAALLVTGLASALTQSSHAASPASTTARPSAVGVDPAHASGLPASKLGALARTTGTQAVFVQFSGAGAASVSSAAMRASTGTLSQRESTAKSDALARRAAVGTDATNALAAAKHVDAKAAQIFSVSNAIPGAGMLVDAAALKALAALPNVVKISKIIPKTPANSSAAQLTRVLDTWQNTHDYGAGVTIGIIDTGIDYTHADFGGAGTVAAYKAAFKTSDSLLYPWHDDLPALAKAKIAGGYDFAGNAYQADPTSANYNPVPRPDPNPLDCNSHGTHVAGTAAGYGENTDGSTFTGSYSGLTSSSLNAMKIGPGMAPEAKLYSLRVFGCQGSTDLVIPALDAALDPNGDGDFSDHLDVVNMSLGGDYDTPDDPENAVVNTLATDGVLSVVAMGNNGDLTDTGGAPGNALRSLAVASSVDALQLRDGLKINAPTGLVSDDIALGQNSIAYSYLDHPTPVTGQVVTLPDANADGCSPITQDLTGKVAWLYWDDNDATRACGSAARAANAKAAGAVGAIFTSTLSVFGAGITGDPDIPVFQLTGDATSALSSAAAAGTLNVTFDGSLAASFPERDPSIVDLASSFTSRGTHGSIGVVKPDVAAPGDTIVSAGEGTGDGVLIDSGTSMATPHTAGIAALVIAAHPTWTTEQVKADIMNTANHDLYSQPNQTGPIYGPARDGSGRVDAYSAVTNQLLAYDTDASIAGGVSASFGVVAAPTSQTTVTKTRTVTLFNTGSTVKGYLLSYAPAVKQPGVAYSMSPSSGTIPAGGSVPITVTMTITTALLRHTIDPTMQVDQLGAPREFVSDASGRLLIQQSNGSILRVPVYGAAKPTSSLTASASYGPAGAASLVLSGTGVHNGSGVTAYSSLGSTMSLGATSPKEAACDDNSVTQCTINQTATGGDIHYVGAGSAKTDGSLANGWLWFGISTYGDSATIGNSTIPYVDIDTNGDGEPDYEVYAQNYTGTDLLLANLVDLSSGEVIDQEPVDFEFGDVDTNDFDTNTVLLPVWPKLIGVKDSATKFPITYSVGENSLFGSAAFGGDIDDVGPVKYDVVNPGVSAAAPLYADQPGLQVPLTVAAPNTKALVFHLHNADGTRDQVVTLQTRTASALSIKVPATFTKGKAITITGTLTDASSKAAIAGASVLLYSRPSSGSTFTKLATLTTNSTGGVSSSQKPTVATVYKLVYAGAPLHAPVTSALLASRPT
ncbi:S8 family serine peptidase [Jatrophihabitans sp.]|uniref:S8 family peptidase n=1 Tax=Jatrophihabitans sp. TaxID=1932789 RepID=UPI0030C6D71E|nr:peptidase [Jatrophihabitans sp.]